MNALKQIRIMLSPSGSGLVLYVSISVIVVFLGSFLPLVNKLFAGTHYTFNSLISSYWHDTLRFISKAPFANQALEYLIWAAVGAFCYCLVWIIFNSYFAARNDVMIGTHFLFQGDSRKIYWIEVSLRVILRLCAIILLLILTVFFVSFLYPASSAVMDQWVKHINVLHYALYALFAFSGLVVTFHIYINTAA